MELRSTAPKVALTHAFGTPYDNAVATARTCYSSRIITDDDVRAKPELRDKIAKSIYLAGHHTTLQHAHFQFTIDGVSRQALWAFFHAHPFYNSEQVSQRYVEVRAGRVLKPALENASLDATYDAVVERQMRVYQELLTLLEPAARDAYYTVYPARRKRADDARWQSAIKKRCQEVARYVLPIGTHAHLYHTISGLTLHRYHRLARHPGCPTEVRLIVDQMVAHASADDPLFGESLEGPLEDARMLEHILDDDTRTRADTTTTRAFLREFDGALEGRTSRLISSTPEPVRALANAVRQTLGLPSSSMPDDDAISLALDPSQNKYLGESLNLGSLSRTMRALDLVHFTFQKKLSHSADSQGQRHRMTPGARPELTLHVVPGEPDYITPSLFAHPLAEKARDLYAREMKTVWDDVAFLVDKGVSHEAWQYVLPNAVAVRFTETGSLLDQHHKWTTRLCFNAQEEIWRAVLDEVNAVRAIAPQIGHWLLPPCGLRKHAGTTPHCPEGERFCGIPVWKQTHEEYVRLL
jgi:flavin-dependent thymidylate synthase